MVTRDDAMRRMGLSGSEDRAATLLSIAPDLSDADLKAVMVEFWTMTEAWGGSAMRHEMLGLLKRVGYITDTRKKPHLDRSMPGYGVVKVFRGNIGEDPTQGFCWTTSETTAEFFARHPFTPRGWFLGLGRSEPYGEIRPGAVPSVWVGWVERSKILGFFDGRGESEVVIDPEDLLHFDLKSQAA